MSPIETAVPRTNPAGRAKNIFSMRCGIVLLTALLCVPPRVSAQSPELPAQSGGFIVRLGSDTVQIERFTRTSSRIEGTLVFRVPRTLVVRYALDVSASGAPLRYQVATSLGDGRPTTSGGQATFEYGADSVTRTLLINGQPVVDRMAASRAFPGPSVPYLGVSLMMYELAFGAARPMTESGESSIELLTLSRMQRRPARTRVWFIGPDSVEMDYFGAARSGFKLDSVGRIVRADWRATTYKYQMSRLDDLDVEAVARSWHEADVLRGAMGVLSPSDTVRASVGGADLTITYGRPSKRGRAIWGGLVPWDTIWRFGADRATQIETSMRIQLGGAALPPGQYTLWMLPSAGGDSRLIVSSLTNTWGTAYDPSRDVAQVPMTRSRLSQPVERFSISIEDEHLRVRWDTLEWSVPIQVTEQPPPSRRSESLSAHSATGVQEPLQRKQLRSHLRPVGEQPVVQLSQGPRIEHVDPAIAAAHLAHDARAPQHSEVPGDRRTTDRELLRDLACRPGSVAERVEDLSPNRVGDRPEDIRRRFPLALHVSFS